MRTAVLLGAVLGIMMAVRPSLAQPAPQGADSKAVEACLDRVDISIGQNCIGVVTHSCMTAADGDSAKVKACVVRELRVWEAQLDAALRRIQKGGFREIVAATRQSQEAWQSSRRALCGVFEKIDPGTLPGGESYCTMHETASRALLLRRLGDAVNEH
jgi:uncharacterized protein YecT (DUF1311 family)